MDNTHTTSTHQGPFPSHTLGFTCPSLPSLPWNAPSKKVQKLVRDFSFHQFRCAQILFKLTSVWSSEFHNQHQNNTKVPKHTHRTRKGRSVQSNTVKPAVNGVNGSAVVQKTSRHTKVRSPVLTTRASDVHRKRKAEVAGCSANQSSNSPRPKRAAQTPKTMKRNKRKERVKQQHNMPKPKSSASSHSHSAKAVNVEARQTPPPTSVIVNGPSFRKKRCNAGIPTSPSSIAAHNITPLVSSRRIAKRRALVSVNVTANKVGRCVSPIASCVSNVPVPDVPVPDNSIPVISPPTPVR